MGETHPLISVIVPVYKVEAYLPKCIDSILAQTYDALEVILVDDGSPDRCPAICDAAAQRDARVRVIHQKNGGLSAARNAGIEAAQGSWLAFVDSDDTIAPEMLETMLKRAQTDGSDMVICGCALVDETGKALDIWRPAAEEKTVEREELLSHLETVHITAWNRLYRREIFETIRFPVGKVHEDEFTAHWLIWQCRKISLMPEPYYLYLQRQGSIMAAGFTEKKLDAVLAMADRTEFALDRKLYGLAVNSYDLALGIAARARKEKIGGERLIQAEAEAKRLAPRMYKMPGHRRIKAKARLYWFSPGLYSCVGKLYSVLKRKNGRN